MFSVFGFNLTAGRKKLLNKSRFKLLQLLQILACRTDKRLLPDTYEGCSNMNASRFITFVTYMLRQNGICFYKELYVTFKLAPDLKKNTVHLSSCIPLNEGHLSILTNSML